MAQQLNPQNEQFIQQALADGRFPDRESLLNAAVDTLREERPNIVITEAMGRLVDEALDSSEAGEGREYSEADWQDLLQRALQQARDEKRAAS
jgi:Arc/MetJ-type ribon-helix-helix transcriptional regulator